MAGLSNAELANLGDTLETRLVWMGLKNGGSEISGGGYTRKACTFTSDADGDLTLDATVSFTGTASQAVSEVAFYSANAAGTERAAWPLSGDAAFSSGGEYNVTAGTITGTSS
jgi:hypothetical protein